MAKPITKLLQRLKDEKSEVGDDLISPMQSLGLSTATDIQGHGGEVNSGAGNRDGAVRRRQYNPGQRNTHRPGQFQDQPRRHHNPGVVNGRSQSHDGRRGGRTVRGKQGNRMGDSGRNEQEEDPNNRNREARSGSNNGTRSQSQRGRSNNFQGREQSKTTYKPRDRKVDVLTFRKLKNYDRSEPSKILLELGHDYSGFDDLVNSESQNSERTLLMLSVLAKACQCQLYPQNLINILNKLPRSAFFTVGVTNTILGIHRQNEENQQKKIVMDVLLILRELFVRLPAACADQTGILALLKREVDKMRGESDAMDDEVLECLNEVTELEEKKLYRLKCMTYKAKDARDMDDDIPPDDYRTMSILPTMEDLDPNTKPFLRKNKISGKYEDTGHYIDVQFRLLREDFIQPLRNGIAEYKNFQDCKRPQDIRVYDNVVILRSVCSKTDLLYRLQFDVSKLKRVKWEVSKRLIYGSLVCLSSNDFRTFYIATVADRDATLLKDGMIDVKFEHDLVEIDAIESIQRFVMVETTAYYEAYKHVLKALQRIENLPFDRYIVQCHDQVQTPRYQREHPCFDLRPLVDEEIVLRSDRNRLLQLRKESYNFSHKSAPARNVMVSDLREWPCGELLNLDDSQYRALQTALSKEFSVIQGPPGTGKTYLGLKIVKALLHNFKNWDHIDERKRPMLIVCYTNHALDQFLTGIIKFYNGNVIRVGGRISDKSLEEYSLKAWKQKARKEGQFKDLARLGFIHGEKLQKLHEQIEEDGQRIDAAKNGVLTFDTISHVLGSRHREQLESFGDFTMWLGLNGAVFSDDVVVREEPEDEGQEEEEMIDVEEEADIARNNRQLLEDEGDIIWNFEKIQQHSRQKGKHCIAFDISMLDNDGFQMPKEQVKKQKKKIIQLMKSENRLSRSDVNKIEDIWHIDIYTRWRLYKYWVSIFCEQLRKKVTEKNEEYKAACKVIREITLEKEKKILREADVIAMTTTGAARYQTLLKDINPRIIVVEEAAEVLEGHIITTLSPGCEQLILIGDHKQLRPNPNVYKLARNYHLDISLFERMLKNGIRCDTLELQHRMRPEISKLMKPIYPNLKDHQSVKKYEQVKGITKNIFFINHNEPEKHDTESRSHSNEYEARYVTQLSDYLLKQGYIPQQITILTAYSGQMFQCKKLMPKNRFGGVRITPVDNYQGEENDIIILSLVRSNQEGRVGFLKIENRICVALSRAKVGLYVIGNFDMLQEQCDLWRELTIMLRKTNEIGETLLLQCQNHPNDPGIEITCPADFQKAPAGGCQKMCDARLECGHVCAMPCHPVDPFHEDYQCLKPCPNRCQNGHPCKRKCFQDCGNCQAQVLKLIPMCGHKDKVPCYKSPEEHKCTNRCIKILQCGHICGNLCGFGHECQTKIEHVWPCGHSAMINCTEQETAECKEPCGEMLTCGHICKGNCSDCLTGRLHQACKEGCNRTLVCGHACESFCSDCPPCSRKCENQCPHSRCPKSCGDVCAPCTEPCNCTCVHLKCTKRCSEPCNRLKCNEPCRKLLKCKHPCIGLCGEPCPRYCRICNADVVTEILFGNEDEEFARFVELPDCGHIIEYNSLDKWMEMKSDTTTSILLKSCPRCKTPIRRCVRYSQSINKILQMINDVKTKCIGKRRDIENHRDILKSNIKTRLIKYVRSNSTDILKIVEKMKKLVTLCMTKNELITLENQCTILFKALDEFIKFKELISNDNPKAIISKAEVERNFWNFANWLTCKRKVFSEQEENDATRELSRQRYLYRLLLQQNAVAKKGCKLTAIAEVYLRNCARFLKKGKPLTEDDEKILKKTLRTLETIAPFSGLGITEGERLEILKAMSLTKGHWFKCPKGHIYAIGECGGATEEGTCPECKSPIGGRSHALRSDNTLAPEMDGASHAAWSDQANLLNYRLDL